MQCLVKMVTYKLNDIALLELSPLRLHAASCTMHSVPWEQRNSLCLVLVLVRLQLAVLHRKPTLLSISLAEQHISATLQEP